MIMKEKIRGGPEVSEALGEISLQGPKQYIRQIFSIYTMKNSENLGPLVSGDLHDMSCSSIVRTTPRYAYTSIVISGYHNLYL